MLAILLESPRNVRLILCTATAIVTTTYFLTKWLRLKRYFKSLNIPSGPKPLPLFGNLFQVLGSGFVNFDKMIIQKYGKDKRVVGYFAGTSPIILCSDPNMIKNVMIKDFNSFVNHRVLDVLLIEPFDKTLSFLKDDEWKNVRSILTPSFTTGKLKGMSKIIQQISEVAIKQIDDIASSDQYFDTEKIFSSLKIDILASCCFGVQTECLENQDNELTKQIKKVFSPEINKKILFMYLMPTLFKFASKKGWVEIFPMDSVRYLQQTIDEVIGRRRLKIDYRDDFIQNMIDHENTSNDINDNQKNETKPHKKTLTSKEILSQAMVFLTAGYETTNIALTFIAYSLAKNPECQKKLCLEIDSAFEKHGFINYDMVNDIPYLDMVINETLRMYPPEVRTDRVANDEYTFNGMRIPKGSVLAVSIYSVHHDPELYPDPEIFNPERFTSEFKKQHESDGTFIPFGLGPRNCIGMRFAMLQIKIIICEILLKYEFFTCDKTLADLKFVHSGFLKLASPIVLKLKHRTETI